MTLTAKPENEKVAERAHGARRAYQSPRLKRLGSVRELTLGGTGAMGDGKTGMGMA
jgi:hypothetical protein